MPNDSSRVLAPETELPWDEARAALNAFLQPLSLQTRCVALHDVDADGVAAGVVWQRAMERLGFENVVRVVPDRERNAWTPQNRARVLAANPETLFVMDLGSQNQSVVPDVRACFIDHHRPEGVPPNDTLISGYDWNPIPNTSLMVYQLFRNRVEIEDLDWIAAIGTLSDLGERTTFEIIAQAKKKYTAKYLKEATTLVNAARRASVSDPECAARALLQHTNPRDLVNSESADVQRLKGARREVKAALAEAKKAAPRFIGRAAILEMNSPCQIHPLIAQIWRGRLPKYFVIAANHGYLPDRVNFSARGEGVLQFLRGFSPDERTTFGHGHDAASGGSLSVEEWREFLRQMEAAD